MFWKIYFYLLCTIFFIDIFFRFYFSGLNIDWIGLSVFVFLPSVVSAVGLYCFAYGKRIFNKLFWKLFFVVFVVDRFFYLLDSVEVSKEIHGENFSLINDIGTTLLYSSFEMPLFIALFLYAFCGEKSGKA